MVEILVHGGICILQAPVMKHKRQSKHVSFSQCHTCNRSMPFNRANGLNITTSAKTGSQFVKRRSTRLRSASIDVAFSIVFYVS